MKRQQISAFLSVVFLTMILTGFAQKLPLPPADSTIAGGITTYQVQQDETIATIARRYDIGYFELVAANPQVNPRTLMPGTMLVIPQQFILPLEPHQGIIINLGTMRLFYFPKNQPYFYTYPVGIGKQDWVTPLGKLSIIQKTRDPIWHVPDSIYDYRKANGDPTPKFIKPGPDNPLGKFALRLSKPTYLIHGTNEPESVGVRSSAGCIHLYPEDIEELFNHVAISETVLIINQPYSAGWNGKILYVEAHLPLAEDREKLQDTDSIALNIINNIAKIPMHINWKIITETITDHTGIPVKAGSDTCE